MDIALIFLNLADFIKLCFLSGVAMFKVFATTWQFYAVIGLLLVLFGTETLFHYYFIERKEEEEFQAYLETEE